MESKLAEIRAANGEVYGISADSPFSLAKWAEQEGYTFDLLSDFGKDVARAYDTLFEELIGLKGVPKRSAFLVDANGALVMQDVRDDPGETPDIAGFIAKLKSLG